ncbi:MAG: beta strand repeat-containing protein [Terriglobales bacterium]
MFALVAFSLTGPAPALAQCTDSWTGGGGDGQWSDVLNWSNGSEPGSGDNVCIQSGAAVNLDVGDTILDLTVGGGNSLTLPSVTNASPTLNVGGFSAANSGEIILSPPVSFGSALLLFSASGTATLSGNGTITLNANSFGSDSIGGSALLLNKSTIQGGGNVDLTLNNSSSGVINANESGVQLVVGRNQTQGVSTNTGLMEATNGGQLAMGSLTLNNVGGTVKASGKNSYVQLVGEGQGGETFIGGTWTTASGGVIQVIDTTALLDGTNGNTITNSGTMQLVDGAPHPGGIFQGTINNKGTIQILSKGGGVGVNIPGGQTFTLTGTGSLTMGDGTDNAYNNQDYISGATLVNQQLIQGTGNILNLTGFNNSGIINANVPTATNNLQLLLGRAGSSTNTGTVEATNGGALVIGSVTINNTGGTIKADGANSYVALASSLGTSGLTISGGTYTTSNGGIIYGQQGSLLDGTTNSVINSGTLIAQDTQNGSFNGFQAQGTLNNTGTIEILPAGDQVFLQIPNGENLTLTGSGTVIMGDGTDNSYNNQATLGSDFGTNGTFTNQSTVEGTGSITGVGAIVNNGLINANVPVGANGLLLTASRSGSFTNNGILEATNGGMFAMDPSFGLQGPFSNPGTLTAAANSTINVVNTDNFTNLANGVLTGGTYAVTGKLLIPGNITTNAAKITLTGTASQILNPNTNALAGFVTNAAQGIFILAGGQNFNSAGTFTNHGGIGILKGSTFTVGAGGSYVQNGGRTVVDGVLTVSNADQRTDESDFALEPSAGPVKIAKGALYGSGGNIVAHLYSAGTILPGNSATSAGKLLVTGAYTQTSAGTLDANIGGTNPGQFSQLNVNGTAELAGTLNIVLLNNFLPAIGSTFQILRAKQVNGTFATVNGTAINGNEHFTVTYNANNVTLTVVSGT